MFLYFKVRRCFLCLMQREIELSVVFEAAEMARGGIVNRDRTKLGRDGVE